MKKFGINILRFFAILFILYPMFLLVFDIVFKNEKYKPNLLTKQGHNNMRLHDVKYYKDVDILFLGSSHAYRGFDTRIFSKKGYHVFNMGSSAQTPLQTEVLLKRYIKQLKPKLAVLEVYPFLFTTDGIESSIDIMSNDINDFNSFKLAIAQKNIKVFNTFLASFIKDFSGKKILVNLPMGKEYKYHKGGYISRDMSYYKYDHTIEKESLKFKQNQLDAFYEIIKLLKEYNIDYILVQAPVTQAKYNAILNNKSFDSMMSNNGRYFNFNELIKLDDSLHFFDSHHLNQVGVNLFNKKFIKLIEHKK